MSATNGTTAKPTPATSAVDPQRRTLPNNQDAERALLGAMLLDPAQSDIVLAMLPPLGMSREPLFFNQAHQWIYESIVQIVEGRRMLDMTVLADALNNEHRLEACGGGAYLSTLVDELYSLSQVPEYCRIVEHKWIARTGIRLMQDAAERLMRDGAKVIETVDQLEQRIGQLASRTVRGDFVPIQRIVDAKIQSIDEIRSGKRDQPGLLCGFEPIDAMTLGFRPQEVVIIAARPSVGKTALAMNMAMNISLREVNPLPVGIFSLEMSAEQLGERTLAEEAHRPLNEVRAPRFIGHDSVEAIRSASQVIRGARIFIDDASGMTVREIRAKARRLKRKMPNLSTLIIDHVTLIQGSERDLREMFTKISHALKVLARELNLPLICLCQLTRGSEARGAKKGPDMQRPKISDLRETGAWEEDADIVILLHRENREAETCEVNVAKNKNGRTGKFELAFCGAQARFTEIPK